MDGFFGGELNMRYHAICNESGVLLAIGTGPGGIEITEEEYNTLLTEIRTKAALVDSLYNGSITLEDVPADWQEEIQRRVDERIQREGEMEDQELSAEETLSILLGGEGA